MKTLLSALLIAAVFTAGVTAQNDYVIGAQDVLNITVVGEPDLTNKFTVEQDGTFTFPFIGRIKAGGVTQRALEEQLTKALANGFLRNPQVAVAVETYRSQRIIVIGEVRTPGEYQLTGDMTLLTALARAGGMTGLSADEALIIHALRHGQTAPDIERIDLVALHAGNMQLNRPLQDGDTVNLPKAKSLTVGGYVKTPSEISYVRGMTVLQAVMRAGGPTDRGSDKKLTIKRMVNGKSTDIKAIQTDIVQPGDTIVVGARTF
jgi:polysaccharide export outer membrane protein